MLNNAFKPPKKQTFISVFTRHHTEYQSNSDISHERCCNVIFLLKFKGIV